MDERVAVDLGGGGEEEPRAVLARALEQAKVAISGGSKIARPLKASGIFPPMVVDMIDAGQQSGQLADLMLKLADGKTLVGDKTVNATTDWQVSEMTLQDIEWHGLNPKTMTDDPVVKSPDLSKVEEIGWTDLMPGSGHGTPGGSTRVDWIEVYAQKVPRQ